MPEWIETTGDIMTDAVCKHTLYCKNYPSMCEQCKNGWTTKLKNLHDTKEGEREYAYRVEEKERREEFRAQHSDSKSEKEG